MQCFVYRSERAEDTYVFLARRDDFAVLPDALAARLGALVPVLELALSPERRLAREDPRKVMANLLAEGYHLQLPPPLAERKGS